MNEDMNAIRGVMFAAPMSLALWVLILWVFI